MEADVYRFLEKERAVQKITDIVSEHTELSLRDRDFALRYALEYHSMPEWSRIYGVGLTSLYRTLNKPEVQKIIEDVRYNFTSYVVANQVKLVRMAHEVYAKIMSRTMTDENMDTIRRAANDVLSFWYKSNQSGDNSELVQVNINSGLQEGPSPIGEGDMSLTLRRMRDEIIEMEQIASIIQSSEGDDDAGEDIGVTEADDGVPDSVE